MPMQGDLKGSILNNTASKQRNGYALSTLGVNEAQKFA